MIIHCPACSADFRVPDGVIPPSGRKMRCSACAHTWHFVPAGDVPAGIVPVEAAPAAPDFQTAMAGAVGTPPEPQPDETAPPPRPRAKKPEKPFVIKTARPLWARGKMGVAGYAAAILIFAAVIPVLHPALVSVLPSLHIILQVLG